MMTATAKPMSPEQSRYLRDLLTEREGVPAAEAIRQTLNQERAQGTLDSRTASAAITALLKVAKPETKVSKPPTSSPVSPAVLAGYYAIPLDGTLHYFRVRNVEAGRWAGRTFVDEQASDDFYPVRGQRATQVLAAIKADPEAGARYGQTIGRCWRCRRTLTDETSRALGIGPDCRAKD